MFGPAVETIATLDEHLRQATGASPMGGKLLQTAWRGAASAPWLLRQPSARAPPEISKKRPPKNQIVMADQAVFGPHCPATARMATLCKLK